MSFFRVISCRCRPTSGFSLIELLVVVGILGVLATLLFVGFQNFTQQTSLETATQNLYTALTEARSATLASEYGSQYGVRIESDRIIRFRGPTYNALDANNQTTTFRGIVATTTLSGGPTILFQKQTGTTTNSGTIRLTNEATLASTTMTVYITGIVSIP